MYLDDKLQQAETKYLLKYRNQGDIFYDIPFWNTGLRQRLTTLEDLPSPSALYQNPEAKSFMHDRSEVTSDWMFYKRLRASNLSVGVITCLRPLTQKALCYVYLSVLEVSNKIISLRVNLNTEVHTKIESKYLNNKNIESQSGQQTMRVYFTIPSMQDAIALAQKPEVGIFGKSF